MVRSEHHGRICCVGRAGYVCTELPAASNRRKDDDLHRYLSALPAITADVASPQSKAQTPERGGSEAPTARSTHSPTHLKSRRTIRNPSRTTAVRHFVDAVLKKIGSLPSEP